MNKVKKLLAGMFLFNAALAFGSPAPKDTIPAELKFSNFEKNLDSLMNIWYVQEAVDEDTTRMVDADTTVLFPQIPDSFYINRLRKIPSFIELTYNDIVKSYIQVYTVKKRDKLEVMLGLKDYYFPIFEQILDSYQIPEELKYLAVIESALNPRALSRVGASGMWQFMYGTGKLYNLNVNTFIDERRDPIAATHAAARFLKDLYRIYDDWILVIAAYNCGPGNVNKAIRRSGGKKNYWDIYYYLPKETRGYVPAFIAATYAINYYKDHNLTPKYIDVPQVSDTIMINQNVHFQQIASVLNIPMQQLKDYNPQYKLDIIPGQWGSYPLRLPANYTTRFIEYEDSIYNYKDASFNIAELRLGNPSNYKGNASYSGSAPDGKQRIHYVVRSGDNLGAIATKYHVSLSNLREWNNIRKNTIRAGQKLVIYIPRKGGAAIKEDQPTLTASVSSTSSDSPRTSASNELQQEEFVYYKVKTGDTLWEIANQYPGVSDKDLIKWNNLSSNGKVYPGQKLKIKKSN
ncbi:MAG TPA: LysM peptidoglycan-binding domain-containing protein [Bacteroidales bacterium]|nr:LysM peptidoglycan-binding domain-containing protein [Bacteroidales bacterium]